MIAKPNLVALIVACASFMQQIDGTIVTTALPQMAVSLHTTPIQLSVSITAYLLSLAIFIPISGWMADRFGASNVFRVAMAVFTVGSILCAVSGNVVELTAARLLQGMGGAMMQPIGRLLVVRAAQKSEFIVALAWLQVPAQIGPVIGPPLGGFIVSTLSWQWIFLVNVPVGIIGIILATIFIKDDGHRDRRPLDGIGFALSGVGLSFLMYGLDLLGHSGFDRTQMYGALGAGALLGVAAVWHSTRHPFPLLRLPLLKIHTFRINFFAGSLFRYGTDSIPFLLPLYFQLVLGKSPLESGLLTLASALGSMSMRFVAKPILRRYGFKRLLVVNGMIGAATSFVAAAFNETTPAVAIFLVLLLCSFFRNLQVSSLNTVAYSDIPKEQMSASISFAAMIQQLSNGIAIALAAIVLHLMLVLRGSTVLTRGDFIWDFAAMAMIALSSVPFYARLPASAGAELSGHKYKTRTDEAATVR